MGLRYHYLLPETAAFIISNDNDTSPYFSLTSAYKMYHHHDEHQGPRVTPFTFTGCPPC